jgi:hypothetical protein
VWFRCCDGSEFLYELSDTVINPLHDTAYAFLYSPQGKTALASAAAAGSTTTGF